MAWLDANNLSYTREELRAWYDHPARERIPIPGMVEWRQRQAAGDGWRGLLDETGSHDPNVARIAWLEKSLAQAEGEIAQRDAERNRFAGHAARLEEIIRQQAASIEEQSAAVRQKRDVVEQQAAAIRYKDAEAQRQQSTVAELNAAVTEKSAEIRRHRDAADQMRAEVAEKTAAARRLEAQISAMDATIRNQAAAIDRLMSEVAQYRSQIRNAETGRTELPEPDEARVMEQVAAQVSALETENERLRRRLARNAAAAR